MDPMNIRIDRDTPPIREHQVSRRQAAGKFDKTLDQAQSTSGEVVTELKTSEISFRWDMLGLDFRRVSTIEKRLAKAVQGEAVRTNEASLSAEQTETASEITREGGEAEDSANTAKARRAYLPKDTSRETLRYQA